MKHITTTLIRLFLIALMGAMLAGCHTVKLWRADTNQSKQMDKALEQATKEASGQVPGDISEALLPPLQIQLPKGKKAPLETQFNFTVSNAPARQVFMNLVEGTPYSVIVAPEVSGRISLDLRNTTVPGAMKAIRRVYGYGFYQEDNRFYISGRGMQTRLFPVNYLNFIRQGESSTRVSGGDLARSGTSEVTWIERAS